MHLDPMPLPPDPSDRPHTTTPRLGPPRCPTWADHDWSEPLIHASGYVPFKGWFRTEHQTCRSCGRALCTDRWTLIEPRTTRVGSSVTDR